MSKFWALFKINLNIAFVQLNFVRRRRPSSRNTFIITLILIIGAIAAYLSYFGWRLTETLQPLGLSWIVLSFVFILITLLTFMFSLYTVNSVLFESHDTDQLLAYPINLSSILYARLLALVAESWIVGLVLAIPLTVVYILRVGGVAWWFYLYMLFGTLLAVLVPLALIILIGLITSMVAAGRRFKQIIQLISTVGLVVGLIFLIQYIIGLVELTGITTAAFIDALKSAWPPVGFITSALVNGSFPDFLVALAIGVLPFALLVGLTTWGYRGILTRSNASQRYKAGPLRLKSGAVFPTLLSKEFARYRSSAMYMLNSGIGIVMMTVLSFILLIYGDNFLTVFQRFNIDPLWFITVLFCFMLAATCTTSPSISLEGRNLWIIKSLPLSATQILTAKMTLQLLITVPLILLDTTLVTVAVSGNWLTFLTQLALWLCYSILVGLVGLIFNLHYHRFDFFNDMQVVKSSASVMMAYFTMWLLLAAGLGLFIWLNAYISFVLYIGLWTVLLAVLIAAALWYLRKNAERLFMLLDSDNN